MAVLKARREGTEPMV